MAKTKWYAVAKGRAPGIYTTWDECKAQRAGFSGAVFKSFKTPQEAQAFMISNSSRASVSDVHPSPTVTSASTATVASSGKKVGLTPEQRKRMEENRKRALKIRQMKMMTPSPSQQQQQPECFDLTQDDNDNKKMKTTSANNNPYNKKRARCFDLTRDDDDDNNAFMNSNNNHDNKAKRVRASPNASAYNRPPRYPENDQFNIDYEDMEDSLRHQLDVAPIYDDPTTPNGSKASNVKDANEEEEEEQGDELQMKAIDLASAGKNMFLTGKAGTGKSWVTKKIVHKFQREGKRIHVTAPTGIAAINVGGITINSWGNYHLGSYYDDFNRMWEKRSREKIRDADTLLIDEISMLDGHSFDCLECMISIVRYYDNSDVKKRVTEIREANGSDVTLSDLMLSLRWDEVRGLGDIPPFGGIQLIVVGDFYQLSPVPNGIDVLMEGENLREIDYELKIGRQGAYAFESVSWHKLNLHTIELTNVHRQSDGGFLSFLNAMREGEADLVSNHSETLRQLQAPIVDYGDDIVPTELHSKNFVVDKRNKDELEKLPTSTVTFTSKDDVDFDQAVKKRILQKYMGDNASELSHLHALMLIRSDKIPQGARSELKRDYNLLVEYAQETFFEKGCRVHDFYEMKEDAQVMLLWNLDLRGKLANGSRGVIKGFFPAEGYYALLQGEKLRRSGDTDMGTGKDQDKQVGEKGEDKQKTPHVKVKGEKASTEETESGKKNKDYDFSHLDPDLVERVKGSILQQDWLDEELAAMEIVLTTEMKELPFVKFTHGRERVIRPQPFAKNYRGVGTATRWQIPLTLAWAISIHKSQGLTIERLLVNLIDCFAVGQAYVACSRGKDLESMMIKNFKPNEIKTSEKVKKFYLSLKGGDPYTLTWRDTIAEFDRCAKEERNRQKEMNRHHKNTFCEKCNRTCVVRQIQTNRNNNQGKWYIACPAGDKRDGHTWEFVNTLPLQANSVVATAPSSSGKTLRMFAPGEDGTVPDKLLGKQFCLTGVFPELGGGAGLKLGKD